MYFDYSSNDFAFSSNSSIYNFVKKRLSFGFFILRIKDDSLLYNAIFA